MVNRILPVLLMAMLPFDLVAGLSRGLFPSEATLAAVVGTGVGVYLARQVWGGRLARQEKQTRLQLVSEQGRAFDPQSDEAQVRLDNMQVNAILGTGLLLFGVFLTVVFITSYLFSTPVAAPVSFVGQVVQVAVMLLFDLIVAVIEVFGAKIFLRR